MRYGESSGWILYKCPLLISYYGHDCEYNYSTCTYFWRGRSSIGGRTCPCGRASVRRIKGCCCNVGRKDGRTNGLRLPPAGGQEGLTQLVERRSVVSSRGRAASRERSGGSRRVKANQKAARPRTTTVQYSTTCSTTLFNIHTHSDQTGQVRQSACRPSVGASARQGCRLSGQIFN